MEKTLYGGRLYDLLGFVSSLFLVALGLLGMAGVVFHGLAPNGWFAQRLGQLWSQHPALVSLVIMGLVTVALAARSQVQIRRYSRGGTETPLYIFVTLGTFFAARLFVYGTL